MVYWEWNGVCVLPLTEERVSVELCYHVTFVKLLCGSFTAFLLCIHSLDKTWLFGALMHGNSVTYMAFWASSQLHPKQQAARHLELYSVSQSNTALDPVKQSDLLFLVCKYYFSNETIKKILLHTIFLCRNTSPRYTLARFSKHIFQHHYQRSNN